MNNFLRMTFLVAEQELRVRLRTGRWRWLLGAWFLLVLGFTGLMYYNIQDQDQPGIPLFGGLMLFVLTLALMISPAITAQSVNGERERGTLATLQVTMLTPGSMALGKLLAGWAVGLTALLVTLPCVFWSVALGGVGLGRAGFVMVVTGLLIGVVCAISQALSALLARSITSAMMSYLVVLALAGGTMLLFGLSLSFTETNQQQTDGYSYGKTHPEQIWWMLAPNPYVILADSAPALPRKKHSDQEDEWENDPTNSDDPLTSLGSSVREMRVPEDSADRDKFSKEAHPWVDEYAIWPWGLGFNLLLGVGSVVITARRMATPYRKLSKGVRVA
jgi:ABC-2 type transport system permease protein